MTTIERRGAMSDMYVYRTQDPEIMGAVEQWKADRDAWEKASTALVRKWFGGRKKDRPGRMSRGDRWVGVAVGSGDPPEGWRLDRKLWLWVPHRTSPVGKVIAKELDGCRIPKSPNTHFKGMPAFVMGGGDSRGGIRMHEAGARELDGWIYAVWGCELRPQPHRFSNAYDPDVWTPVPLSQFYAAVEANDAAKGKVDA